MSMYLAVHRKTEQSGFWEFTGIRKSRFRREAVDKRPKKNQMSRLRNAEAEESTEKSETSLRNTAGLCL